MEIIAEIGSTWARDSWPESEEAALRSVSEAARAGATAVKFQLFRADGLYSRERAPELHERVKRYELPLDWLQALREAANEEKVDLWASCFDYDVIHSDGWRFNCLKVASGDLTNKSLVDRLAFACAHFSMNTLGLSYSMALSTGAATMEEVADALSWIGKYNVPHLTLFHCVSAYPAPPLEMNLRAGLEFAGGVDAVGLSDHTKTMQVAPLALALGYTAFEHHFKLPDTPDDNPDAGVAFTPVEFKMYVESLRWTEEVLGDGRKRPMPSEESERVWARRGEDGLRPNVVPD